MAFAFPGCLDARLVTDDAFGEAYDSLSPEERAWIKTAVAMAASAQGPPRDLSLTVTRRPRQGFCLRETARPAEWAVVAWHGDRTGPTRLAAALIPAMLAGVPNILACRVTPGSGPSGSEKIPAPLLAALELAGQELAVSLTPEEALAVFEESRAADPRGRLVLLGDGSCLDPLGRAALAAGIPVRRMAFPVRIGLASPGFDEAAVRFAHPDAIFTALDPSDVPADAEGAESPGTSGFSAVVCAEGDVSRHLGRAPLVLTPENGAYWAWPDLDPEFFREKRLALGGQ